MKGGFSSKPVVGFGSWDCFSIPQLKDRPSDTVKSNDLTRRTEGKSETDGFSGGYLVVLEVSSTQTEGKRRVSFVTKVSFVLQ